MNQYSGKHTWALRAGALLLLCSLSATSVLADGIRSKDKARSPQMMTGAYDVVVQEIREYASTFSLLLRAKYNGVIIRRNVRLKVRSEQSQARKTKPQAPSAPVLSIKRERLVERGRRMMPRSCALLHTHARAVCLRDAQLKRMNRYVGTVLRTAGKNQE